MIDKVEVGKTYRLIDKDGYFNFSSQNKELYERCFDGDKITIEGLYDGGDEGVVDGWIVIIPDEFKYFELTEDDKPEPNAKPQINYTVDWCMPLPDNKEEWNIIVDVLKSYGVEFYDEVFDSHYRYLYSFGQTSRQVGRKVTNHMLEVTLAGAIKMLTRPVKTKNQLKIEMLNDTIAKAKAEIEELENAD